MDTLLKQTIILTLHFRRIITFLKTYLAIFRISNLICWIILQDMLSNMYYTQIKGKCRTKLLDSSKVTSMQQSLGDLHLQL